MNKLVVKLNFEPSAIVIAKCFITQIDDCSVGLSKSNNYYSITITCDKDLEVIENLFFEIYNIIFIYSGAFPEIVSFYENDTVISTEDFIDKYKTKSLYNSFYFGIQDISDKTINQNVIDIFRTLNREPISSMQYLVSDKYSNNILIEHKITLLLHVIDGLIEESEISNSISYIKQNIEQKNIEQNKKHRGRTANYSPKVHHLCSNFFFSYDNQFESEILQQLNKTEYDFVMTLADTRKGYSHFLINKKPHLEKSGKWLSVYFEIVVFILRLYLIKKLCIDFSDEKRIKPFLYFIHDWIEELNGCNNFKTDTYNLKHDEEYQKLANGINNI